MTPTPPQPTTNNTEWEKQWELVKAQAHPITLLALWQDGDFEHIKSFISRIATAEYTRGRNEKEIIICSAIRMPDGYIIRGHRHNDCIATASNIPRYKGSRAHGDNQGFMTSTNRYVTRKEGYEIQKAAGIASRLTDPIEQYHNGELYSEDLY